MEKVPHAIFVSLSNDFICNCRPRLTRSSSASQILNPQIWKRVTNDAGFVREVAPRICGANVRNNQADTGLQIELEWHAADSLLLSVSEGRRKQKSAVTCFMFYEALPSFSDMQHKSIPHAGQQRSPSVLLLKQRKYLPHKYLAARLPASMLAAVNTSRQQPGYN